MPGTTVPPASIAFVFCIEANALAAQGLLLCESIRRYAGRYADCRIIAVSPRPGLGVDGDVQRRLRDLEVEYRSLPLNTTGSPYGPINRVVASRWAEQEIQTEYLVVLDTDMLFVSEPDFLRHDIGVRPVDVKAAASCGPDDPLDAYWGRMCARAGIGLDDLPMIVTSISRVAVRASYNGGFTVARRGANILTRAANVFLDSFFAGDRPDSNRGGNVLASTGRVGVEASQWWGSEQAAMSVTIWSATRDVSIYDERYNIPLHLIGRKTPWPASSGPPILVHYHHLLDRKHRRQLSQALAAIGCPAEPQVWLMDQLARGDPKAGPVTRLLERLTLPKA